MKRAADPALIGRRENSGNRPPPAKAPSLRAKPPPRHPLPLAVHADVQIRIAPYCLHLPRDTGCASTSSLRSRRRETAICTSTILRSEEHTSELQSLTNLVCR